MLLACVPYKPKSEPGDDLPGIKQSYYFCDRGGVYPALGSFSIFKIIVQEDAKLVVMRGLVIDHQEGSG